MRAKTARTIRTFLNNFEPYKALDGTIQKNVYRNVKRIVTRSNTPTLETLGGIDYHRLVEKAGWGV